MLAYTMLRYYHLFEPLMEEYFESTGDSLENITRLIEQSKMWCHIMMIGMYAYIRYKNSI